MIDFLFFMSKLILSLFQMLGLIPRSSAAVAVPNFEIRNCWSRSEKTRYPAKQARGYCASFQAISLFFLLILSAAVYAQIDADTITKSGAVCGNGKREAFEPCDLSSNASDNDLCPQIGKAAGIAMVCRAELCSCLPRKYIVCGDKHTTGNEMCEAADKDYCPKVSELLGAKVECNAKTCLCKATADSLFEVKAAEPAANLTKSLCGNRQVDANEECDPPGRMCTFGKTIGICSQSCRCEELKDSETENATATNSSASPANVSAVTTNSSAESNVSAQKAEEPQAKADSASLTDSPANVNSGVSDTTYTVILIVLVVLFIIALAVGSFFIYKRSQIGDFGDPEVFSQDSESEPKAQ